MQTKKINYLKIPKEAYFWLKQKVKFGWDTKIIVLSVIPQPEEGTRAVIDFTNENVKFSGKGIGITNLLCGSCGKIVAEKIPDRMILNIIIRCGKCRAYNEVPMQWGKFRLQDIREGFITPLVVIGLLLVFASIIFEGKILGIVGGLLTLIGTVILLFVKRTTKVYKEE